MIPDDTKGMIDRYAKDGVQPGGFLTAVLSNDLFDALNRADMHNRESIFSICEYIYNKIPMECWGTRAKVDAWVIKKHREREVMFIEDDASREDRGL